MVVRYERVPPAVDRDGGHRRPAPSLTKPAYGGGDGPGPFRLDRGGKRGPYGERRAPSSVTIAVTSSAGVVEGRVPGAALAAR